MTRRPAPRPDDTLYVYALLDTRIPVPRVRSHPIEIVRAGALFAAVERVASAPDLSEAALRSQHRIVTRLSRDVGAILPVRFGSLVARSELERIVSLRRTTIRAALRQVRGRTQMTVRVFGPASPQRGQPVSRTGTEYLLLRAASARPALSPVARAIRRAVRPVVSRERIDPVRGGVQTTMHHLVPRRSVPRYLALVGSAIARTASPLQVSVAGPFPPFAFAPDLWSDGD
jgi:hypothetical protein